MSLIKNDLLSLVLLLRVFIIAYGYKVETIFEVNSLIFDVSPNPYFSNWEAVIGPDKRSFDSVKVPVSQDLPAELMVKGEIQYKGQTTVEFDVLACEYFADPLFMPEVLERGMPADKFPQECPIYKCEECELQNFKIPAHKIPQGTPDGEVTMAVELYEVGKPTYVHVYVTGEIRNVAPSHNYG